MHCDCAALGKTGNDDIGCLDSALLLARDQRLELCGAVANAVLVNRSLVLQAQDVVPGTHCHTVVDRHGPHWRVREHEAQGQRFGQTQLRHNGLEIVAIRAQPMQPDHAAAGILAGFELDRFGC